MHDPVDLVLCYVKPPWAYFTDKPLDKQWGDDWDDFPYDCNGGEPYDYPLRVAYDCELETPAEKGGINVPWSVQQINSGVIAWLATPCWRKDKPVVIMAGATLPEFCQKVKEAGGNVYMSIDFDCAP